MTEEFGDNGTSSSQAINLKLPATCDPPGDSNPPKEAVWIIFGATGSLGRSLVRAVTGHGDKVTSVGWSQEDDLQDLQSWQNKNSIGMLCDVRVKENVEAVIKKSVDHWGRADVIANCINFGIIAACEDQSEHDLRSQLETNFFATYTIISQTLPLFRAQQHGRYLIFSCTAGSLGVPGLGPYCASKFAIEGLLESMLYEVDAYGIKATLVEQGHMRIDEASVSGGGGPKKAAAFRVKEGVSSVYTDPHSPAMHAQRMVRWLVDRQPVSSARSAELSWQLAHCRYPPLRLLLGSYAVESVRDRLRCIIEEIEDWKHLNFPSDEDDLGQSGRDEGDIMTVD